MDQIVDLKTYILREIELFAGFNGLVEDLKSSVMERDWVKLEKEIKGLNLIAASIAEIEEKRHACVKEMKKNLSLPDRESIKQVMSRFAPEEKDQVMDLNTRLKLEIIKVRATSNGLNHFLRNVSILLKGIIGAVLPYTKGKLYSRKGTVNETPSDSMMINKQL
jgi:hypothetical protein